MPNRPSILYPRRRLAFTLVELMVVILIIGILISILIPVVNKIRTAAQKTDSLALINAIRGAVEAYHGTYNAYPGPVPDLLMFQVPGGTNAPPFPNGIAAGLSNNHMTQSENLVLGLMGGLYYDNGVILYDSSKVGTGPRSLNPGSPGQQQPFYTNSKDLTKSFFSDRVDNAGQPVPVCHDTNVPEFQDRFTQPMPILYLRAKKGAPGVMSDEMTYNAMTSAQLFQYDVRQYYGYMAEPGSPPKPLVIGGKLQAGDGKGNNKDQGLWHLGPGAQQMTDPWSPRLANYAIPYFKHPTLNVLGTTTNDQGTPRSKDQFILISAGADRIYGTNDDLASFGSVGPE